MSTFFKVTGKFIGERPVTVVNETLSKRPIAIETEASMNNTLVVDLLKTATKDNLNLAKKIIPGDYVTLWVDVVTRKTTNGNWFPSLTCFKIEKYVPQTTQDFLLPTIVVEAKEVEQPPILPNSDDLPF